MVELQPQVKPKGQGPDGADIFIVAHDKGALDWRMMPGPNGKIATIFFKPLPPRAAR